jgi:P-type conjugative transfer protein TrbJ
MKSLFGGILIIAFGLQLAWMPRLAQAQVSTVCVNCGSEVTQYLNYAELLSQTASSASQLSTQISQYATMVQNLTSLPTQMLSDVTAPFKSQLSDLSTLYTAATSLSSSASKVQKLIDNNLQSSAAAGMTPSAYVKYVADQASTRGGVYKQMIDDNNTKLKSLQDTSTAFQKAADNTSNLQGTLDGLQQTNSLAAASGQVATDMLGVQRQAIGITLQDKADHEASSAAALQMRQDDLSAQRTQNGNFRNAFK